MKLLMSCRTDVVYRRWSNQGIPNFRCACEASTAVHSSVNRNLMFEDGEVRRVPFAWRTSITQEPGRLQGIVTKVPMSSDALPSLC